MTAPRCTFELRDRVRRAAVRWHARRARRLLEHDIGRPFDRELSAAIDAAVLLEDVASRSACVQPEEPAEGVSL